MGVVGFGWLAGVVAVVSTAVMAGQASALDGTAWSLTALTGSVSLVGAPTIRFESGRVSGFDGCNTYRAPYTADASSFALAGPIVTTRKECGGAAMVQARAMQAALTAARTARVVGDDLVLLDAAGAELATFAAAPQDVTGTTWMVTGYNNGKQAVVSVLTGTQLTLDFGKDGRASGSAGCNRFTGTYKVAGSTVSIGPVAATRKMCLEPASVMEQEDAYLKALTMGSRVRFDGNRLEIRTDDGALTIDALRTK
jgi:heat shock protein HslJ